MEVKELHRGRLIDHLHLVVKDLKATKKFYFSVFEVLQIPIGGQAEDHFWVDELFVSSLDSKASAGALTGRVHLAFQAKDQDTVKRFYEAALKAGGKDHGAPGERPYHPGYFAAFVTDPDGNNIEAVYHGPAKKSADSVKITWS
jgi:catechol 2,3-dioxygenase-like lactoylglutathione lyase family enzyme